MTSSPLTPVADAIAAILGSAAAPHDVETVPLLRAAGRTLARDLGALRTQPPCDVSAMDGYAVRAADLGRIPAVLAVLGESAAGRAFPGEIGPGQAARIFTGAPVPPGADLAGTFHFGPAFSFYNALSYNRSEYQDNYLSGTATVPTAGKVVPNTPEWMNKFAANLNVGDIDAQLTGDYVGKRYATYTNDLSVSSYFLLGLNVSGKLPLASTWLKNVQWNIGVTNLVNRQGVLQTVVGAASGTYATYPIPPRMGFITLKADI